MTFSVIYCTYCVSYLVSASLAITFAQPRTQILVLNQCFLLLDNTCFNASSLEDVTINPTILSAFPHGFSPKLLFIS